MMYLSLIFDVLDRLRLLTKASPFYLFDYWLDFLPFYYDIKLLIILYGSRKYDKWFGNPNKKEDKRAVMSEEEVEEWCDK